MATSVSSWRVDIDSLSFQPRDHAALCMVHRRAFGTLLGFLPRPEDCRRYFDANRAAFEQAAAAKIARANLRADANFHLTSRDVSRARGECRDKGKGASAESSVDSIDKAAFVSLPSVKGWCPTVFEPMAASDGLLASLKPHVKGWSATDLRLIADAVEEHGSGRCLLTHRANLQVRGLSSTSAAAIAAIMMSAGLVSSDAAAERRRNIFVALSQSTESQAVAARLESWLQSSAAPTELPAKFSFCVTASIHHEDCASADICIHAIGNEVWVAPGGAVIGTLTPDPLAAIDSLTRAFLRLAARTRAVRRMRDLIAHVGIDTVLNEAQLSQARLASLPPIERTRYVGALHDDRFGLGVPFGRADVASLRAVAALADSFADGALRLTPQRSWVLTGLRSESIEKLWLEAQAAGFIVHDDDSRLHIAVCVGGSGCDKAQIDMHELAKSLAPFWRSPDMLHLSGCSKGCAHPRVAELTIVAGAPANHFHVLRESRADGVPERSLSAGALREYLAGFVRGRLS